MFEPFKTALKKEGHGVMAKNNYLEPNKITLACRVDKALDQNCLGGTSYEELGLLEFGLLTSKLWMQRPNLVTYTSQNHTMHLDSKQYNSNDEDKDSTQGKDHIVATKLLNIITTIAATKFEVPT